MRYEMAANVLHDAELPMSAGSDTEETSTIKDLKQTIQKTKAAAYPRTPSEEHINFKNALYFADKHSREGSQSPVKSVFKPVYVRRHQPLKDFREQSFEVDNTVGASDAGSTMCSTLRKSHRELEAQSVMGDMEGTATELQRVFDQLSSQLDQENALLKSEQKHKEKSVQVNSGTSSELATDLQGAASAVLEDTEGCQSLYASRSRVSSNRNSSERSPVMDRGKAAITDNSMDAKGSNVTEEDHGKAGPQSRSSSQTTSGRVGMIRQGSATLPRSRSREESDSLKKPGKYTRKPSRSSSFNRSVDHEIKPYLLSVSNRSASQDKVDTTQARSSTLRCSIRDGLECVRPKIQILGIKECDSSQPPVIISSRTALETYNRLQASRALKTESIISTQQACDDSDSDRPTKSSSERIIVQTKAEVHRASTGDYQTSTGPSSAKPPQLPSLGTVKIEVEADSEPEHHSHDIEVRGNYKGLKVPDPLRTQPCDVDDHSFTHDVAKALDVFVIGQGRDPQARRPSYNGPSELRPPNVARPVYSSVQNLHWPPETSGSEQKTSASEESQHFTHTLRIQEKEHEGRRVVRHKRFVNPEMPGYVGFANLPNQVHRKSVKKGFEFTLMVVGECGLGKSTLVNSLFLTDLYPERHIPGSKDKLEKTVTIEASTVEIEERGVRLRLTVVDTPGFGDAMNNTDCFKSIIKYVDDQYEKYLNDESGLNRRNIVDNRVHCCFYFINPAGHGLKPLDISFMRTLHHKVNIVPVIAKADTLTRPEVARLKRKVMEQIEENGISIYPLPDCDSDEDEDYKEQCRQLKAAVPFAVVGSNQIMEVRGRKVRGRTYPWGVVEVENPDHCDFIKLRTMLITHMQDLQEVTQDIHYENFRSQRLATTPGHGANKRASKTPRRGESERSGDQERLLMEREKELLRVKEELVRMQEEMQRQRSASGASGKSVSTGNLPPLRNVSASGAAPALPTNPPPISNNNLKATASTGSAHNGKTHTGVNGRQAPVVNVNNV